MKRWLASVMTLLVLGTASGTAAAHFQLIYTPLVNLPRAASIPLRLIFWHPLENSEVMAMPAIREFYYLHRGKRTPLEGAVAESTFQGRLGSARAYAGEVRLNRTGDYQFVLIPEPYFEASEDAWIQQFTKAYVNRSGIPDSWDQPAGLVTEIVPLVRPTNVIAGSSFTGRVLSGGKPVPGASIEVEYISADIDAANHRVASDRSVTPVGGAIEIRSDANGYFTYAIPKAGFWGFAALGVGPETEWQGKPLSQDAVIWVRAFDLP
ncbi:MAG: DUF4198 domain-containing protein [Pseudomonadota bacterium]